MPPVSNLLSLWRSLPGTICKRASAIPADDVHTWMGQQPLFEGLGFSIRHYEGYPLVALKNFSGIERKTLIIVS